MKRRERRRDGCPPKQVNPLKTKFAECLLSLRLNWVTESFDNLNKPFIIGKYPLLLYCTIY